MEEQNKVDSSAGPNRWLIAAAGVVMQLLLGTVYAWSVFKAPFAETGMASATEVGYTFTILMAVVGLAAAFGGKFVDKAGARMVATMGVTLFAIGLLLAGVAAQIGNKWLLWIGFGVIGGIGNGLGYVTPIAVLVRWFPDKRGFITGLAVMGFGFGSVLMFFLAPQLLAKLGLANSFYAFGAIFFVVLVSAAQFFRNPPEGWKPPVAVQQKAAAAASVPVADLSKALGMYQFYLLWVILFINVSAGLALISNLVPMAKEACGLTLAEAANISAITMVFNGLGRIIWASLSDVLGRKLTFALVLGSQIPVVVVVANTGSPLIFAILACYWMACYGAGFATMPAYAADTFTAKNMGQIYGKILLAWSAAGIVGPIMMEQIKVATGSFKGALYAAAAMLAVGFIVNLFYKKPQAEQAPQPVVAEPKAA